MNISEKALKHIDACRFCWMCRHICPIGNATGQERNNARSRALGLSLVARGAESAENVADNIYECSLCGACVKECVTGWDPVMFVQEAKTDAVLSGCIPDYVEKMLALREKTGNIYGAEISADFPVVEVGADTLFFTGQDARFKCPEAVGSAVGLLLRAGVKFDCLRGEPESGYAMWFLTGNTAETQQAAAKCAEALSEYQSVIVYDPADLSFIKRKYKEWGISVGAEIIGFTDYIIRLVVQGKLILSASDRAYTVQDSFHSARELENPASVRRLVSMCGQNREMLLHGKDTFLAGDCIMSVYMPEVMRETARRRLINAENAGAETLVAESPAEYVRLKAESGKVRVITVQDMVLENIK